MPTLIRFSEKNQKTLLETVIYYTRFNADSTEVIKIKAKSIFYSNSISQILMK